MSKESFDSFTIVKKSRINKPRLSFKKIKEDILGPKYILSLVFVGDKISRDLNKNHRNKDMPANVLSFPLSTDEGEVFINLKKARDEAPRFGMSFTKFVGYLFIHAALHLKGMQHGCTMEKEEKRLLRYYLG